MDSDLPYAEHSGDLHLGSWSMGCHVLSTGQKVVTQRQFITIIGMKGRGSQPTHRLYQIINDPVLKIIITEELAQAMLNPIVFNGSNKQIHYGYEGAVIVEFCKALMAARKFGALKTEKELRYAQQAENLITALAGSMIEVLIEAATGKREVWTKKDLQTIFERYLLKEHAKYASMFPEEFYQNIARLRGWDYQPFKRPGALAGYTNDLIYSRLAPNILAELQERNPSIKPRRRKHKHYQFLTEGTGIPELDKHISGVLFLQRSSKTWTKFYTQLQIAAPKLNETLPIIFEDEE